MRNQQGKVFYFDAQQFQKSTDTEELRHFLSEQRIGSPRSFTDKIASVFQKGSGNRSYFFANVPYETITGGVPCFGVKGKPMGFTRSINYTELLFASEAELRGTGFNEIVFGAGYLKPEEAVARSEAELHAIVQRSAGSVSAAISPSRVKDAAMAAEKLWEAQEQNPSTRFIIRMKDAETRSLELLQEIYLLLPHSLRLQLGFETNITEADLNAIRDNGGFPIYVMTAESTERINPANYDFPIVFFDYENRKTASYNPTRLAKLEAIAGDDDPLRAAIFDYAEKKVCEEKRVKYSSFRFYEEIAEKRLAGAAYWWRNPRVSSIEELKAAYDDQIELLSNEELRRDALNEFLTKILPGSSISTQMAKIVLSESYPNRRELLDFLGRELHQTSQIEAIQAVKKALTNHYQKQLVQLQEEHQKSDEESERIHASDMQKKTAEIQSLTGKITALEEDNRKLQVKAEKAAQQRSRSQGENPEAAGHLEGLEHIAGAQRRRRKQRNKRLLIGGIAAAVVIVIALAVFFVLGSSGKKKDDPETSGSSVISESIVESTVTPTPAVTTTSVQHSVQTPTATPTPEEMQETAEPSVEASPGEILSGDENGQDNASVEHGTGENSEQTDPGAAPMEENAEDK